MTNELKGNKNNVAIGLASSEVIDRFGSANAEFIKGLRGVDYETGQVFERGLEGISNYNVNPEYAERNIKQQAGFSAEVVKTSRDNAENIIAGRSERTFRSEDVPGYGSNNTVSDHVVVDGNGQVIEHAQMKFVNDPNQLVDKIAGGSGGKNDLSRYLQNDFIDLPTEQVEVAKAYAARQAENFSEQADRALRDGKEDLAKRLQQKADNYSQIKEKIRDTGITSEEAVNYRLNPTWETAKDIGSISHRAGVEGAKFGAVIGGTISIATNALALINGDKDLKEAAVDCVITTAKAAGVGYVTGFTGAAIKGSMQQSSHLGIRALSKTSLPALVVSTCMQLSSSIADYVKGNIDEKALFHATAMTTTSVMASTAGATLGQIAIPVPVLGAMIGGMIGHTLSAMFYQSYLSALDSAEMAHQRYMFIKEKCEAARALNEQYQKELKVIISEKIQCSIDMQTELFSTLNEIDVVSSDDFAKSVNQFAEKLGRSLPLNTQKEFDDFMKSNDALSL